MDQSQNKAIEKALQKVISNEAALELSQLDGKELTKTYECLNEQMAFNDLLPEVPTVKSVLNELYELSEAEFSGGFTVTELQDLILQQVAFLSELLGIELEELEG